LPVARSGYGHTGQLPIGPVVVVKTLLVGYLSSTTSERGLTSEMQANLAHRCFPWYGLEEAIPVAFEGRIRWTSVIKGVLVLFGILFAV
jgi:hypothetical protein